MSKEDLVKYLGQHFVSFGFQDVTPGVYDRKHGGHGEPQSTSGFIISIGGNWFLITAGHVLRDIERARANGQVLRSFYLDDGWNHHSKSRMTIPLDFDHEPRDFFVDDDGSDYAAIYLRPYYRPLLEANGVQPIDELAWERDVPESFDQCVLLGMPSQFLIIKNSTSSRDLELSKALVSIAVTEIPRPDFTNKDKDLFYGQLLGLDDELTDIDGMSGGPIFGFKRIDGEMRYWVIALQSGWFSGKRIIFACRIRQLCEVLRKRIIEQIEREMEPPPTPA